MAVSIPSDLRYDSIATLAQGRRPRTSFMYKLIATVRGGATNSPQIAARFATVDEARAGAKQLISENNRVTRVMIVEDGVQTKFVEWIERA